MAAHRVDEACDRFEAAWRNGQEPRIETYLESFAEPERPALFRELLVLELELRQGEGRRPDPVEYHRRFPAETATVAAAFGTRPDVRDVDGSRPRQRPDVAEDLLFGILALQNNFISREALLGAFNAWGQDRARSLRQHLSDRGALAGPRFVLLEALVQEHLKLHGNDPTQSLAALSSLGPVQRALESIVDPDVRATLSFAGTDPCCEYGEPMPRAETRRVSEAVRFRILRPHAVGGLGKVFAAHDEELNREVALKEIKPEFADDPESRARFLREAEITGGLEHPGVLSMAWDTTKMAVRFTRCASFEATASRMPFSGSMRRKTPVATPASGPSPCASC
jgi:hypothetical protein